MGTFYHFSCSPLNVHTRHDLADTSLLLRATESDCTKYDQHEQQDVLQQWLA